MKKTIRSTALALPFLLLSTTYTFALNVDEIVAKANDVNYYTGDDGRARVKMDIVDAQGRERERSFTILRKDGEAGAQKIYVYFNRPADVKKTVFLVWKKEEGDDERWLYLPALDLVKRIAASDERTSFVGSDFFYEDVSGRKPSEDTHELAQETDEYYIVKSTPKDKTAVEFASYTTYIHKSSFIPVKVEFYDASGTKYREGEALKVEMVQNLPTVTMARMKDLQTGSTTTLSYDKVEYNIGLEDDVFTERYLRSAPAQHLKW